MSLTTPRSGRAVLNLALLALGACRDHALTREGASAPPPVSEAGTAPLGLDASREVERKDGRESEFLEAAPVRGKSVGHTSVVFKLELEGGAEAAYKPESRRGKLRYRGEVAAYRLALALGLGNVPPAFPRRFEAAALKTALGGDSTEAGALFQHEVIARAGGGVYGALIPWIRGLEFLPLETPAWRARWQAWLTEAKPDGASATRRGQDEDGTAEERALAAQISVMIVFDVVTGNWDRWSGGNVGLDRQKNMLLFIDNDGAFFDPAPVDLSRKQVAILKGIDRFSRAFVSRLRALDDAAVAAALGRDADGTPLLSAGQRSGVEERRKNALTIIDAKIATQGEKQVLFYR